MKTTHPCFAIVFAVAACLGATSLSAAEPILPDLKSLAREPARWEPDIKGKAALFAPNVIWLEGVTFTEGTIECDILGKSSPRGSNFPGIAFHGENNSTYECVYFRPFNF